MGGNSGHRRRGGGGGSRGGHRANYGMMMPPECAGTAQLRIRAEAANRPVIAWLQGVGHLIRFVARHNCPGLIVKRLSCKLGWLNCVEKAKASRRRIKWSSYFHRWSRRPGLERDPGVGGAVRRIGDRGGGGGKRCLVPSITCVAAELLTFMLYLGPRSAANETLFLVGN